MTSATTRVKQAIKDLQDGKMIILRDHENREDEGDLIMAAEKITNETMNFIIRNSSGIVCLSLTDEMMQKFQLKYMVPMDLNGSAKQTPFTVSIDAKHGITTGVSAYDRCQTILTLTNNDATLDDIVTPGHIFPLCAKKGGVLERDGHTEGSLDLVKLAGLKPLAVLCEMMNANGTMMKDKELQEFSKTHNLTILSIDDIITYRLIHESLIKDMAHTVIPTEEYGDLQVLAIKEEITDKEHLVLYKKISSHEPAIVRIHSSCLTGDVFHSHRCDCHDQLHYSLQQINEHGGVLIYLNQEGRGIGLFNKIKAYALQEKGFDTVEAQEQLGLPIDQREYYIAAHILKYLNITHVKLLTNNPHKIEALEKFGIESVTYQKMPEFKNDVNENYLRVKKEKLFSTKKDK